MILGSIYAGVLGVMMGSAANALIDRLPKEISWIKGRSKCDQCGHVLSWKDLIPVFSFIFLQGKCRYCQSPIPVRNLFVEIITAIGFILIFNFQFTIFNAIILCLLFWTSVIITVMDWETKLVAENMVVLMGIFVLAWQIVNNQLLNVANLWGLLFGILVIGGIWAVTRGRAMGFGDVEIIAVIGWWLGWPKIIIGLWIAFVSGAIIGIIKLMQKKAGLKSEIAFGPFLIIGLWTAIVWADKLIAIWNTLMY